jgi:Putative Actinobacterial Holin-X, holin superfamily III
MPTPETETESAGLGTAAKLVAEKASTIARLELELASMELKRKVGAIGVGLGLGFAALFLLLYAIGFLFATIAAALAEFMPTWLALLIVGGGLLVIAAILGAFAVRSLKRGTPPVPKQAIDEAKLTTQALKSNGSG